MHVWCNISIRMLLFLTYRHYSSSGLRVLTSLALQSSPIQVQTSTQRPQSITTRWVFIQKIHIRHDNHDSTSTYNFVGMSVGEFQESSQRFFCNIDGRSFILENFRSHVFTAILETEDMQSKYDLDIALQVRVPEWNVFVNIFIIVKKRRSFRTGRTTSIPLQIVHLTQLIRSSKWEDRHRSESVVSWLSSFEQSIWKNVSILISISKKFRARFTFWL